MTREVREARCAHCGKPFVTGHRIVDIVGLGFVHGYGCADAVNDPRCSICQQVIVVEAGEKAANSPGDHDPAYHVAKAYGTQVPA